MNELKNIICKRLEIRDFHFVEIESKKRIRPSQVKDLKKYLMKKKKVEHVKSAFFFDQFLDTPTMELARLGMSLRLRYKRGGSDVYLQYKGPGFIENGLLYRSEFSSGKLKRVVLEESHHDIIHFDKTTIRKILSGLDPAMASAMRRHIGAARMARISTGPIIAIYQKDKFRVNVGPAFLEPSIDRIFAFHINKQGLHPLSSFYEYENEIKASHRSLNAKLVHVPDLLEFDAKITKKFDLQPEMLDKYHRCISIFLSGKKKK
jgi:CYTH domain